MERNIPTLLDLRKRAASVALSCLKCGHKAVISIDTLIEQLGPQFEFTGLKAKSRCKKCRGQEIHIAPIWPDPQKARQEKLKRD